MVHPRLSVSEVSSWRWSFDDDLAFWAEAGIEHVGLSFRKLEEAGLEHAVARVRAAGLAVSNLVEVGWFVLDDDTGWGAQRARLALAVEVAAEVGAPCLVLTTGPAGHLSWDAAALMLREALEPIARLAATRGVVLAVENTSPLRLDLSFSTTLRDTVDLAARLGAGVCVEVSSCFMERHLAATFDAAGPLLAHVQLSDVVVGSLCTPDRAVPGDGHVPLEAIVRALGAAGYGGAFELELVGPRIEAEGYAAAISRAVASTSAILAAAGV